jgi:hypothetical protein
LKTAYLGGLGRKINNPAIVLLDMTRQLGIIPAREGCAPALALALFVMPNKQLGQIYQLKISLDSPPEYPV